MGVEAEVKAGMLSVLDVSGWDCRRPMTVIYANDRYLAPAQIAFRQFLLDRREGALTPGPSGRGAGGEAWNKKSGLVSAR